MVYKEDDIEKQLWAYMDGTCDATDTLRIEKLIASNRQWQQAYESLLQADAFVKEAAVPDQPSLRFSKNVMEAIAAAIPAPARKYINNRVIKVIAASFVATIGVLFVFALLQIDFSTHGSGLLKDKLPQVQGQTVWHMVKYVLTPVTIVLILILLDGMRKKRFPQRSNL